MDRDTVGHCRIVIALLILVRSSLVMTDPLPPHAIVRLLQAYGSDSCICGQQSYVHHDGDWRALRNSLIPALKPVLLEHHRKVAGSQDESPLSARLLRAL